MFDQLAALPRFRARVIALSNLGCFLGLSYIWNARPPLYTTHLSEVFLFSYAVCQRFICHSDQEVRCSRHGEARVADGFLLGPSRSVSSTFFQTFFWV